MLVFFFFFFARKQYIRLRLFRIRHFLDELLVTSIIVPGNAQGHAVGLGKRIACGGWEAGGGG